MRGDVQHWAAAIAEAARLPADLVLERSRQIGITAARNYRLQTLYREWDNGVRVSKGVLTMSKPKLTNSGLPAQRALKDNGPSKDEPLLEVLTKVSRGQR